MTKSYINKAKQLLNSNRRGKKYANRAIYVCTMCVWSTVFSRCCCFCCGIHNTPVYTDIEKCLNYFDNFDKIYHFSTSFCSGWCVSTHTAILFSSIICSALFRFNFKEYRAVLLAIPVRAFSVQPLHDTFTSILNRAIAVQSFIWKDGDDKTKKFT